MCLIYFTGIYLSLNGAVIPNNGYIAISDLGTRNRSPLVCHTNHPASSATSGGDWYSPEGVRVSSVVERESVKGLARDRAPMIVRLFKRSSESSPMEGIYHCVVNDSRNMEQMVYVGIYKSEHGKS